MKDLVSKLIAGLHWFILAYGLYGAWVAYDEHEVQLQDIISRGSDLDGQIVANEKRVKEIEEYVKKTDEYKTRVEQVAKNIESVQKQLPAETNDTQILSFFQKEINSLNIKDANFTPGKEEKSIYYISKEYSLKAKGTFLQFLIFLERIGTADRIYNIKDLKLSSPGESQRGRFQIISGEGTIQAFRFNPDFKVDRGF
jgi:Tfp pilus assembly protein PilO